jgi:putative nucleotidyltransferase with HDIG domain
MDPRQIPILVVDDDAAFGSMLKDLLEDRGYPVVVTQSPENALKSLDDRPAAVAILDLIMPGMGGLELADRVREKSPDTQVVILTGYGDIQSAVEGLRRGVSDYLDKAALDADRLSRTVLSAAERGHLTRQNRELVAKLLATNRLLVGLKELTGQLAGEPHQDRVLLHLVDAARALSGARTSRAVLLGRTHGDQLVVSAAVGDGAEPLAGARLEADEGLTATAARTNLVQRVVRTAEHPGFSARIDGMPTPLPGFLAAPVRHASIYGALLVAGRTAPFTEEEGAMLGALARQGAVALENAAQQERSVNFFTHVSEILVSFLETMDVHYPGHSRGVAALADMVTRRLGLSDADRRSIHFGALLHDVGKVLVDPAVLAESGPVTEAGLEALRQHATLGAQYLKPIMLWEDILPVIQCHHERWDGKGYPTGLAGEAIPLGARVVSVADAFDAMTRARPHGVRHTPEEALAELEECAGGQFDPKIVRLFVAEYRQRADQLPV